MENTRKKYYGEGYQPLDFLSKNPEHGIGFAVGNILKYTTRAGFKEDAVSDMEKVTRYIQELQKIHNTDTNVENSLWVNDHDKVLEMIINQKIDISARLLKLKIISNVLYSTDDTESPVIGFEERMTRALTYSHRLQKWFETSKED